jgi:hypothetical protein
LGTFAAGILAVAASGAQAAPQLTRVSTDPYTNTDSQHQTEVEPDTFAAGSTMVAAFQTGRFTDGGSSNIGWARFAADIPATGAGTWTSGFLPGITTLSQPAGSYNRATDPSVANDPDHKAWLISSLALTGSTGSAIVVSRSTDDGKTWGSPVTVATAGTGASLDKDWIVCDRTPSSPHYGNCYLEWDDYGHGNLIQMSTSSDGGQSWSAPQATADHATGLGGQPVVQPSGHVIVPIANANETAILAFSSSDGGTTWSGAVTVSSPVDARASDLRNSPLPSADVDAQGRVYLVWQDCRFRTNCHSDDIIMSTSSDGQNWSSVSRVPIDDLSSTADYFIPGLSVDPSTSGANAHLVLAYYYYPDFACSPACQLDLGYVSSPDGGAHWSPPTQLAGPMSLSWLPSTNQGYMVGDYISTSFVDGSARTVVPIAAAPTNSGLDEAMFGSADLPLLPASSGAGAPPPGPGPGTATASTSTSAPATITPPGSAGPGSAGGSGAHLSAPAEHAPIFEALRLSPKQFVAAPSGPSVAVVAGTRVSYALSEPALSTFTVMRLRSGRREHGRCAKAGPVNEGHRRCTRAIRLRGGFSASGLTGANRFRFMGRLGGHTLRPGRYRLVGVAVNAGAQSSRARSTDFRVVSPRGVRRF